MESKTHPDTLARMAMLNRMHEEAKRKAQQQASTGRLPFLSARNQVTHFKPSSQATV